MTRHASAPCRWLAAAAFAAMALPVQAHSWYDAVCCSGFDCAPIRADRVSVQDEGWLIELDVGDHPLVVAPRRYLVEWESRRLRTSQDEDFHACVSARDNRLLCLYVPPMGT